MSSLSRFISWHDLIKTSCIHVLFVEGVIVDADMTVKLYYEDIP